MNIVSINVGRRRRLEGRGFDGATGIFKEPVSGEVVIAELGCQGDTIVDGRHHGGPDQAVYVYRQEDYHWWSDELGRRLPPGTFGENLTVSGLPGPGAVIGSRLVFATVVLEVTAPRIPCNTLAARMGDPAFLKHFMGAERPGLYCRVIVPGTLSAGDEFDVHAYPGAPVTTVEVFRARQRRLERGEIQRLLAAPMDARSRRHFEKKLNPARGSSPAPL